MTEQVTPPHLSHKVFKRFESVLELATHSWPQPVEVDPSKWGLTQITVAYGIRNARESLLRYEWPTTIPYDTFKRISLHMTVTPLPSGMVRIGPRTISNASAITAEAPSTTNPQPFELNNLNLVEVTLLLRLAHNRCLARPIRLSLTDDQATTFGACYDIALVKQTDNSYILT